MGENDEGRKSGVEEKMGSVTEAPEGGEAMNEPERDYLGNIICHCAACDWCKSLEDSAGRTIYFCMNADSTAYLEETGLLGGCTFPPEYEMPEER